MDEFRKSMLSYYEILLITRTYHVLAIFKKGNNIFLCYVKQAPLKREAFVKGKNVLPLGENSFLLERFPMKSEIILQGKIYSLHPADVPDDIIYLSRQQKKNPLNIPLPLD